MNNGITIRLIGHLSEVKHCTVVFRGNSGLMLNELVGFAVPEWILKKMKLQMQSSRTDGPKTPKVNDKSKETQALQQVKKQLMALQRKCC